MTWFAYLLVATAALVVAYAFVGYPLALRLVSGRKTGREPSEPERWPTLSITVPAYNEESQIRETLESLLALDYPEDRRQILVVSDGSTDATDRIVAEYEDRGVELLRMPERVGKSAAENAARHHLRGDIVINTDASVRIEPDAVQKLVAHFRDPTVGVASGRDVSVERGTASRNRGEAGYVGYEMWIRDLETRAGGIVGASGCLYAIRRELHDVEVPEHLSRDFMSALTARERGFRAVSVPTALCRVPRTSSLRGEYRRKIRTIVRGIQTLLHKAHLMNPGEYGLFAWKLWSHKVARWLVPWAGAAALVGCALLLPTTAWAAWPLAGAGLLGVLAVTGWLWPRERTVPAVFSVPTYLVAGSLATCVATVRALRGYDASIWEPTRREPADTAVAAD